MNLFPRSTIRETRAINRNNSHTWTWFELSVGPLSDTEGFVERWRGKAVRNLHAHSEFEEQTIEIPKKGLHGKAESGDVLAVWAHTQFPG